MLERKRKVMCVPSGTAASLTHRHRSFPSSVPPVCVCVVLQAAPDTYAVVTLYDPHRLPIPNIEYRSGGCCLFGGCWLGGRWLAGLAGACLVGAGLLVVGAGLVGAEHYLL